MTVLLLINRDEPLRILLHMSVFPPSETSIYGDDIVVDVDGYVV